MKRGWFEAARLLRERAVNLRGQASLSETRRQAVEDVLRIFSAEAIQAVRAEWIALAIEEAADLLDRMARECETPEPEL